MWTGLLHHVTGEHQWGLGGCYHGPLEEKSNKELIPKGSTAHRKITELIMDERWSKTIPKFRSTGALECFHAHILMYTSNETPSYHLCMRPELLAALDYNEHRRQMANTATTRCSR